MTAALFKTPADLTITPRDRRFGRDQAQNRWWAGGDPIATAFYNALSVTFPKGEAMFIEAVKAHRDGVPAKLDAEIKAFVSQEVMHSREHLAFNRRIVEAGYDTSKLDAKVDEVMEFIKTRPQIVNLCATIALEHYTAILAEQFLQDKALMEQADREQAEMWKWHAIEEIEHKGVAFDTWLYATRDWSRFRRWFLKSRLMVMVSIFFWANRYEGMLELLKQDGITGWKAHKGLLGFLFGNPGVLRKLARPWAAYFLPGFHPWNRDERELVAKYDRELSEKLPLAA